MAKVSLAKLFDRVNEIDKTSQVAVMQSEDSLQISEKNRINLERLIATLRVDGDFQTDTVKPDNTLQQSFANLTSSVEILRQDVDQLYQAFYLSQQGRQSILRQEDRALFKEEDALQKKIGEKSERGGLSRAMKRDPNQRQQDLEREVGKKRKAILKGLGLGLLSSFGMALGTSAITSMGGGDATETRQFLSGELMGSADEQQLTEALIAGEEGVRTKAYQDSEGIWTIGYGQTRINGRPVREGDAITKEEALTGFRSDVTSHAQRAINQLGEERWKKLDPKARAVLTSLAYNYGSIPPEVLPAARSGTNEDIAKSMDALYGDNRGILKGRRQREQSILRGNLRGSDENPVRLDKDFLPGGKFDEKRTDIQATSMPSNPDFKGVGANQGFETSSLQSSSTANIASINLPPQIIDGGTSGGQQRGQARAEGPPSVHSTTNPAMFGNVITNRFLSVVV